MMMWAQLQKIFGSLREDEYGAIAPDEFQLAAAALLVHVATIDGKYGADEHKKLVQLVKEHFSMSAEHAAELISRARKREEAAVDIYSFTRVLTRKLDQSGRQEIVEMLWQVAFADGVIHEYESNLVWRASELLGVSRQDRLRLRDKVKTRMAGK